MKDGVISRALQELRLSDSLLGFDWMGCYLCDNTLCYTTPRDLKNMILLCLNPNPYLSLLFVISYCQWEMSDTGGILSSEKVLPKYEGGQTERKPIKRNALRGFNLSHTVEVFCRETFLIDGSKSNSCVMENTRGKMTHDWRGPIVVLRQPGTEIDPRFYEDVTAADLRIVVDYFPSY
jgi:hypothetical protein